MPHRWPSILLLALLAAGCALRERPPAPATGEGPAAQVVSSREYRVEQQLSLSNTGEHSPARQNLWVALLRDLPPYQQVLSRTISPGGFTLVTDEYDNQYAEFDLSEHLPGTTLAVEISYRVSVNEIEYNLSDCVGTMPDDFTTPELHIESANPQIVALSRELSQGRRTACEQVRAFYDYAGDELVYSYNRRAWGAQATFGLMGADCTEYASLVAALSRAAGIPARYYEGLLYLEDPAMDADEAIAQTEHAWLDVYLPGGGWTALDPTMGRAPANRERYFARYTPDHIIVTTGRNPSTLRGSSYWSHLYWPGNLTTISITRSTWTIAPLDD